MNLRYTSRAKDDIELAFEWYERQRRGFGFDFLDCVELLSYSVGGLLSCVVTSLGWVESGVLGFYGS